MSAPSTCSTILSRRTTPRRRWVAFAAILALAIAAAAVRVDSASATRLFSDGTQMFLQVGCDNTPTVDAYGRPAIGNAVNMTTFVYRGPPYAAYDGSAGAYFRVWIYDHQAGIYRGGPSSWLFVGNAYTISPWVVWPHGKGTFSFYAEYKRFNSWGQPEILGEWARTCTFV